MKYFILIFLLFSKIAFAQEFFDLETKRKQILELHGEEGLAIFDQQIAEAQAKMNAVNYQELADFACLPSDRLTILYPNYNYIKMRITKSNLVRDLQHSMNVVNTVRDRILEGKGIDKAVLADAVDRGVRLKRINEALRATIVNPALSAQDLRKLEFCVPYADRPLDGKRFHSDLNMTVTMFEFTLSSRY